MWGKQWEERRYKALVRSFEGPGPKPESLLMYSDHHTQEVGACSKTGASYNNIWFIMFLDLLLKTLILPFKGGLEQEVLKSLSFFFLSIGTHWLA